MQNELNAVTNLPKEFALLYQEIILYIPRLLSGLFIFLPFLVSALLARRILGRFSRLSHVNPVILELLITAVKVTLLAFGVVTALGTLGIDISAMVASLGLTGFALGFALRDALSNSLAGLLVLVYKTYKINDRIAVSGFEGTVTSIDLRYTTLLTEDGDILIPNANVFTNPIKIFRARDQGGVSVNQP